MRDPNRFLSPAQRAALESDQRIWRAEQLARKTNVVSISEYLYWKKNYPHIENIGCVVRAHLHSSAVRPLVREQRKRERILAQAAEKEERQRKQRKRRKLRNSGTRAERAPKRRSEAGGGE